jgi:hypothetical protein
VSGRVLAVTTNAGVAGATVLFDPSETFNGSMLVPSSAAIRTVTDASGFYTVAVPAGVTGTVAPLFLVPVDVGSRFRVEPEVGYTRTTNEQTIQTTPPTLPVPIPVPIVTNTTSKQVTAVPSIGTGVFFAQSREKIRLHYGARFGYARTSSDFTSVSRTTTAALVETERSAAPGNSALCTCTQVSIPVPVRQHNPP